MKTAISIPDEIFEEAERTAKRLGYSRSELYVRAVKDYLERQRTTGVMEKLDEIYGATDSSLDPVIERMQKESLDKGDW